MRETISTGSRRMRFIGMMMISVVWHQPQCRRLDPSDRRRIQSWDQQMDYQQGRQICECCNDKDDAIAAMRGLKNCADKHGNEHAADGTRHSADSDYRSHRL